MFMPLCILLSMSTVHSGSRGSKNVRAGRSIHMNRCIARPYTQQHTHLCCSHTQIYTVTYTSVLFTYIDIHIYMYIMTVNIQTYIHIHIHHFGCHMNTYRHLLTDIYSKKGQLVPIAISDVHNLPQPPRYGHKAHLCALLI